jgi:O-antigen ligase
MKRENLLSKLRLLYPFLLAICAAFLFYAPTVSNICFGAIGVIWLVSGRFKNKLLYFLSNRTLLLLALLLVLYLLGIFYSTNQAEAINAFLMRLPILLLPLLVGTSPFLLNKTDVGIIFTSFVGASFLLSFYLLIVSLLHTSLSDANLFAFLLSASDSEIVDLAHLRVHRPYLGLMFAFAIVLLTYPDTTFIRKPLIRWGAFFFLFLALLFLIKAKIAALSLIIVLVIRFFPKEHRIGAISGLFLSLIVSLLIPSVRYMAYDRLIMSDGGSRVRNWETSVDAVLASPLIGHGSGDELTVLQVFRDQNSWEYQQAYNSHNQYISLTIQIGMIGLIVFLAALLALYFYSSKHFKPGIYFIILFAFACLSEVIIARNAGVLFFGLFSGIIISHIRYLSERNSIHNA